MLQINGQEKTFLFIGKRIVNLTWLLSKQEVEFIVEFITSTFYENFLLLVCHLVHIFSFNCTWMQIHYIFGESDIESKKQSV